MTEYLPPVEVPKEVEVWMRNNAYKSAFLASMIHLIQRHGGISQSQLDMVKAEMTINRS